MPDAVTADATTPFDPAAQGWERRPADGFSAHTGSVWSRREEGRLAYGFLAGPEHANRQGIVHGGMIMTLADNLLGRTVWETGGVDGCVTMQLNVQFLSAVRMGEFVEARGEVLRRARSVCFVRGMLTAHGRAVAAADGVWKLLRARSGTAAGEDRA